jgi:hypothetical protein
MLPEIVNLVHSIFLVIFSLSIIMAGEKFFQEWRNWLLTFAAIALTVAITAVQHDCWDEFVFEVLYRLNICLGVIYFYIYLFWDSDDEPELTEKEKPLLDPENI